MIEDAEVFATYDLAEMAEAVPSSLYEGAGELSGDAFASPITDYYLTNPIARASETLRECSETYVKPRLAAAAE